MQLPLILNNLAFTYNIIFNKNSSRDKHKTLTAIKIDEYIKVDTIFYIVFNYEVYITIAVMRTIKYKRGNNMCRVCVERILWRILSP